LVVPVARLEELGTLLMERGDETASSPCTLTIIAKPEDGAGGLAERLAHFNDRLSSSGVSIVSVEIAATTPEDIDRIASELPDSFERYIEVPLDARLTPLLNRIRDTGTFAKVRTGGTVSPAFPTAAALASFVSRCVAAGVPFKATAGLHHPLRGSYRLTYEADSASAIMHGFVNLVVATALLRAGYVDEERAVTVLDSTEPQAFSISDDAITWKSHRVTTGDLELTRAQAIRAVGSCSFEDAVNDLRHLRWLD
jgi:hypothetical protein